MRTHIPHPRPKPHLPQAPCSPCQLRQLPCPRLPRRDPFSARLRADDVDRAKVGRGRDGVEESGPVSSLDGEEEVSETLLTRGCCREVEHEWRGDGEKPKFREVREDERLRGLVGRWKREVEGLESLGVFDEEAVEEKGIASVREGEGQVDESREGERGEDVGDVGAGEAREMLEGEMGDSSRTSYTNVIRWRTSGIGEEENDGCGGDLGEGGEREVGEVDEGGGGREEESIGDERGGLATKVNAAGQSKRSAVAGRRERNPPAK